MIIQQVSTRSLVIFIDMYIIIITVVLNLQAYRQTDRKIIFARSMQLFYMIIYENYFRKFYNENYGFINMSLWKHNKLWALNRSFKDGP